MDRPQDLNDVARSKGVGHNLTRWGSPLLTAAGCYPGRDCTIHPSSPIDCAALLWAVSAPIEGADRSRDVFAREPRHPRRIVQPIVASVDTGETREVEREHIRGAGALEARFGCAVNPLLKASALAVGDTRKQWERRAQAPIATAPVQAPQERLDRRDAPRDRPGERTISPLLRGEQLLVRQAIGGHGNDRRYDL